MSLHLSELPIGVFDSGVGGLTVLRALEQALPNECFVYLGDTARLPYGTKSAQTVERYALRATGHLLGVGVKALVVACNTASAVATRTLREAFTEVPVFGVVEPGAEAAAHASRTGCIAVIATESTVRGGAYQRAILAQRADAKVFARPCPLLVSLAEEGWFDGPVARAVVGEYLQAFIAVDERAPDCLLLGCTHFPLLTAAIAGVVGERMQLVDSAATTARVVAGALAEQRLLRHSPAPFKRRLLATDDANRFARVGSAFLGETVRAADVQVVDI